MKRPTQVEYEMDKLAPKEKKATMGIWEREGIIIARQVGQHAGKVELLSLQFEHRFATLSEDTTKRIRQLRSEQLNKLGKASLKFRSLADLEAWLVRY